MKAKDWGKEQRKEAEQQFSTSLGSALKSEDSQALPIPVAETPRDGVQKYALSKKIAPGNLMPRPAPQISSSAW